MDTLTKKVIEIKPIFIFRMSFNNKTIALQKLC